MIDLGNRILLDDGTVICNSDAIIELLYSGEPVSNIFCSDQRDQQEWETSKIECDSDITGPLFADKPQYSDINWFDYWTTPEPYNSIDLDTWCLNKCNNDTEKNRALLELALLKERNMYPIMRHLIYCVDKWREHKIVWGVGRGSSVSSFILHLIGINRINPLEYDLDVTEWLK